jgi:hypothetical protein
MLRTVGDEWSDRLAVAGEVVWRLRHGRGGLPRGYRAALG